VADEKTPYNPIPLAAWRPAYEQKVREAAKNGIKAIVIRPGIVYGSERGIVATLFDNAKQYGQATYIGSGDNFWPTIQVEDLAELFYLAVQRAPAGALYNAADDKPVKFKELAEWVAKAAGNPGKVQSLPLAEAQKTFGPFADGLALSQRIDSSQARKEL